jgi:PTS system nitrogen regulatory IIA component
LPLPDIQALVKRSEIPHERAGGNVRFRKVDIDAWASQRLLGLSEKNLHAFHRASSAKMHDLSATHAIIPELIKPAFIEADFASKTRSSVIRGMVKLADETGLLIHADDLKNMVEEREQMCSTAMSGGFALMHAKLHDPYMFEDTFMVLARSIQPVPFGAPDGNNTKLFFLICTQDDQIHLHLLARLSMMCYHTTMLLDLKEASDADAMYDVLVAAEESVIKDKLK